MKHQSANKTHWWNKRRVGATIVAVALTATTLLAGTFAWNAIQQNALNEARGTEVNPGGRLHDDFNGQNKDIYVENYGSSPIYVKVQLSEYMETGSGAGLKSGDTGYSAKQATSFAPGANINDTATWTVHIPGASVADCGNAADGKFHDYWTWTMGGQKAYMPTFNKDSDSLATDITGLTDFGVGSAAYEHKVSDPASGGTNVFGKDGSQNQYAVGDQQTADATYNNGVVTNEQHTAQSTLTGTVMTMADWIAAGSQPGPYWVVDTDGWAYWAQALQPNTATGLLLDKITLSQEMTEDWYYAIYASSEMASNSDIDTLKTDSTDNGKALLDLIANGIITIPNPSDLFDGGNDQKLVLKLTDTKNVYEVLTDEGTSKSPKELIFDPNGSVLNPKELSGDEINVVLGGDGNYYIDNGDGTATLIKADGTLSSSNIIIGLDNIPATSDDGIVNPAGTLLLSNPTVQYDGTTPYVDLGNGFKVYPGDDNKIGTTEDIVTFGEYAQSDITGATKDPLDWYLLDMQNGNALLTTKEGIEPVQFNLYGNGNVYNDSNLEKWLNSTGGTSVSPSGNNAGFLTTAFDSTEQAKIVAVSNTTDNVIPVVSDGTTWIYNYTPNPISPVPTGDKVFALSGAEVWKYFGPYVTPTDASITTLPPNPEDLTNGYTSATPYAIAMGANINTTVGSYMYNTTRYWTRSAGGDSMYAVFVSVGGYLNWKIDIGTTSTPVCARPALWVTLS
jgi:hypothetical protein